ncbi:1-phosphofructokinase [Metabacillus herbersteinensis]|uniref:Tagatose-6-phosphate kinase n=1 Tax=Metabacillus herbersteinensis TaxID=283816 RepID=A0ABV6GAR9_9BACI
MIYTVTLNPSVDYIVEVEQFELGSLNRTKADTKYPGGKGINVSRVLKRLGIESQVLGFIGGFTGDFVEKFLLNEKIAVDFVEVDADTRINIKLKTGAETEINGIGPSISEAQLAHFYKKIERLRQGDFIVLAGSIPGTLPSSIYVDLAKNCMEKGIRVIADVSGDALTKVLSTNPFLVKPNHHELGEVFGVEIDSVEDAHYYGKKLIDCGVQNVIVSLAEKGALFINKEASYLASVPKGTVKNSVGAGDSVVAGFISAYSTGKSLMDSFQIGVASGSATAFSMELCKKEEVTKLLPQVEIKEI